MNVSYRWLRELAPELEDAPDRIAHRLAMYGAPVDDIVAVGDPLAGIVIAQVLEVRRHPDADRLVLCDVDAGGDASIQVVCGAPNVRPGRYYPFAPVGASLPGDVRIRAAKIRGERSQGMLCSERELGLGREHQGLLELHGEYRPGEPFTEAMGLDDVRLVLDITPNRPDLLSHRGVARELAPHGRTVLPGFSSAKSGDVAPALADVGLLRVAEAGEVAGVRMRIDDAHACIRYIGTVVRNVRIGPSPDWLAGRLRAVGLRPINNVVDATNYVLHELGQPLHAFDLARLQGPAIEVRRARAGETMVTLDGERRVLAPDMLVIADASNPVALAGVMGGEDSEVTSGTRDILLECALFDPNTVRRAARAVGLSTDSSYRFERGVDPEGMDVAVCRALALILAVAGGSVEEQALDLYPSPLEPVRVTLRPARVDDVLGRAFSPDEIVGLLQPLGFEQESTTDAATLRFRVPGSRRYDVEREVDLVEEVARRYGYDRFAEELGAFRPSAVPDDPVADLENRLRHRLIGQGFLEARLAPFAPASAGDVAVLNPLSAGEDRLRRALLPGLLRRLEHNYAHGMRDVRLFEIGTVFAPGDTPNDPPRESLHIAGVLTGARRPPHWSDAREALDTWDLKAMFIEVVEELGFETACVVPADASASSWQLPIELQHGFRAGATARPGIGEAGPVRGRAVDAPPWADPVFGFEVRIDPSMARPRDQRYLPIPAFPAVERDIALLVPEGLATAHLDSAIRESAGPWLESVDVFDLYRGSGIPAGTLSLAYRLRFRSAERTLTDPEVDRAVAGILTRMKDAFGVERRA